MYAHVCAGTFRDALELELQTAVSWSELQGVVSYSELQTLVSLSELQGAVSWLMWVSGTELRHS